MTEREHKISLEGLEVDAADAEVVSRSCEARCELQSLAVGMYGLWNQPGQSLTSW